MHGKEIGEVLKQRVSFIIGVCFIGSVALMAIMAMLRASEIDDPIAQAMVDSGLADLQ